MAICVSIFVAISFAQKKRARNGKSNAIESAVIGTEGSSIQRTETLDGLQSQESLQMDKNVTDQLLEFPPDHQRKTAADGDTSLDTSEF